MSDDNSQIHRIAVCQLTCNHDKEENFNTCNKLILSAKESGAKMVFLPECFDYVESSKELTAEKAEPIDGPLITRYRQVASENKIWLSLGGFHRRVIEPDSNVKMYNSHIIIDDNGEIRLCYDKTHLFEIYMSKQNTTLKESEYISYGQQLCLPIETPIGTLATSICFDMRFPQQSTLLRQLGAEVLTYPSLFTQVTGKAHWHVLLRSRAIENQCFVVAAAQVGKHNEKRSSYGHALVVDPWGQVMVDLEEESPCMKVVHVNLNFLNEVRRDMPILNSFRHDLYLQIPSIKKAIDQPNYKFGHIELANDVVFYESQYCFASVNIKPVVPGHVMVIPKQPRERVVDMTPAETGDLMLTAKLIATKLEKHLNCTSINFSIQDGPEAGQSVKHVHLHILPRKVGDFKKPDEIYEHLRTHDKDMANGLRTQEVMKAEAQEFRKLFGY